MNDLWITPNMVFDGHEVRVGRSVRIQNDKVADIAEPPPGAVPVKGCLSPGFVDLQVNGGGGLMLNSTPTKDAMCQIAAAHRKTGTVAILPTVITDEPEVLEQAAAAARQAKGEDGIIGLHIEGPHIAASRRGTHNAKSIRPLDDHTMDIVAALRGEGIPTKITLAPEAATLDQIARLAEMGAIVSIGHTDATAEEVEAAIRAGASCATHLFNAMSPMTTRAPGAVGAIINSDIHSGIICDGHHVDDRMIQLALRARPSEDLMFLVTDAMATVGGPEAFELYGKTVKLMEGRLVNFEGNLAGAHITQAQGVRRLVDKIGLSLQQALRMAITTPAHVIREDRLASLVGRSVSDLIVLSPDLGDVHSLVDMGQDVWGSDAAE